MTTPKQRRFAKRLETNNCSVCGERYTMQSGIKRCPKCGSVPRQDFYPNSERRPTLLNEERATLDHSGRRKELLNPANRGHTRSLKLED